MTDERQTMAQDGAAAAVAIQFNGGADLPSPPEAEEKAGAAPLPSSSSTPPAPMIQKTIAEAEEGVATSKESSRASKAKENMEFGGAVASIGAGMTVAWYFLSPEARGAHNLRYIVPMLLAFACFISGVSLMLLSMNILGLQEDLVADVQDVASNCLSLLCSIIPVLSVLSTLVLWGNKVYRYVGLTVLGLVMAPIALLRWYIGRKADGGGQQAADNEHKEQLEAAFKFISAISNSATGGLIALVVNYNATGGSGRTKGAILVAIFILFTTVILGFLSLEIRTKVLEINSTRLRGSIIKAIWFVIISMLILLAIALLAEVFAIVEFWIFSAFLPGIFALAGYLFHQYCVQVPRNNVANEYLVEQLNLKADRGIKVTMWSFMAIISIFGGFLHGPDKIEHLKACIILLTSAFMSSFFLTLLTIRPDPTSTSLGAATTMLDWVAAATFAAGILAIIVAMVLEIL